MKHTLIFLAALMLGSPVELHAAEPVAKTPAVTTRPFGIAPAGITSPAMGEAVKRIDEASTLEGNRGSITRFRWSDEAIPKLWSVGLWGPKVNNELMALTSLTPDLTTVELREPHIDDEGLKFLAKLPKLRYLTVGPIERYVKPGYSSVMYSFPALKPRTDRPRVTGKSIQAFADAPVLESLELLDAVVAPSDLAAAAAIPKLSSLGLPHVIDAETVKHLQACRRLNALTLGHREITAAEVEHLSAWKSLRRLTLTHAQLTDGVLEALAKLESVDHLELADCGLTDERLAHLKLSPKVVTLSLRQNEIAGPGLTHLAGLKLKTLGLEYNNLNDDTLQHLPQFGMLEQLFLEYCEKVTDRGIRTGVLQNMTHLKELRLRGMKQVTDASLDDLAKFGHLKTISVRSVGISTAGVERMKQAMPNTLVFR